MRTVAAAKSSCAWGTAEQRRGQLRDELDEIEQRTRRWELALEDGAIEPADAGRRLRELAARRTEIETLLGQPLARVATQDPMPSDAAIERFRAQLREVFLGPDRKLAKGYLRLLIERIDTDGTRVVITGRAAALPPLVSQAEKPSGLADGFSLTCDPAWLPWLDACEIEVPATWVPLPTPPVKEKAPFFPTLAVTLARAHEFRRRLDTGEAQNRADLARQFTMSRARVTQIMMLLRLSPEIVATALATPGPAGGERAMRRLASTGETSARPPQTCRRDV